MTVLELIDLLTRMPPDAVVVIAGEVVDIGFNDIRAPRHCTVWKSGQADRRSDWYESQQLPGGPGVIEAVIIEPVDRPA